MSWMRVGIEMPDSRRTLIDIFSDWRPFFVVMIITPFAPREP